MQKPTQRWQRLSSSAVYLDSLPTRKGFPVCWEIINAEANPQVALMAPFPSSLKETLDEAEQLYQLSASTNFEAHWGFIIWEFNLQIVLVSFLPSDPYTSRSFHADNILEMALVVSFLPKAPSISLSVSTAVHCIKKVSMCYESQKLHRTVWVSYISLCSLKRF